MHSLSKSSLNAESNEGITGAKLNWLRAAVLGANDGIVSVASVVVGVAGVDNSTRFIITAGVATLIAGAMSMGVGEYVSVSSQRDAEVQIGVAHNKLTNPWHAAYASALSFLCGGVIPILTVIVSSARARIPATFISVVCVLIVIGILSARAGGAHKMTAVVRVVIGGMLAMIITFGIGKIFGVAGL